MWASALDAIFEVFLGRLEHCSAPGLSPDFAHPQFPPKGVLLYTSHLSRKDRTGLMNSYHIPRDYIASMASTARMQDRSLWVACWTTDAWQWCGIAALEYILHILSRSFSDLHWLFGWHWTLAPKEWTCFMERTQISLECSQTMWWVCSRWWSCSRMANG